MEQFKAACSDIRRSPYWVGKIALLSLVGCIPIFGQIVLFGYAYTWARDIAWGVHQPMQQRIFADSSDLLRRGSFIFILTLFCMIIPVVLVRLPLAFMFTGFFCFEETPISSFYPESLLDVAGIIVTLLGVVVGVFAALLCWVGSMRIIIYDRLSAGFQLTRMYRMLHEGFSGMIKIFFMALLAGVIGVLFIECVSLCFAAFAAPGALAILTAPEAAGIHSATVNTGNLIILGAVFVCGCALLVYLASAVQTALVLAVARACGYWTRDFEVAKWGGQDDPMPFELRSDGRSDA